jgi:hypothetical protein
MATIQLKRASVPGAVALPAAGADGEPAFAVGGFTNLPPYSGAGADLIVTASGLNYTLVGRTRQVELTGAQTIPGAKTFTGHQIFNGGIELAAGTGPDPSDLSRGLQFFDGYGISLTSARLNYLAGNHYFMTLGGAAEVLYINAGGITFTLGGPARYITLPNDPATAMHAVTKQYVDALAARVRLLEQALRDLQLQSWTPYPPRFPIPP